jgi:hypothetical protein
MSGFKTKVLAQYSVVVAKDEDEDLLADIKKFLATPVEDDDDRRREPKKAPANMQEGLKTVVLKDKSKYARLKAVPLISDQQFLYQVVMSDTYLDIRRKAAEYITDQSLLAKIVTSFEGKDWIMVNNALNHLTDQKIIEDLAKGGNSIVALEKVKDEDLKTALIVKAERYSGDVKGIKDYKNIIKVIPFVYSDALNYIVRKFDNEEVLKRIVLSDPKGGSYYWQSYMKPTKVALVKLNDVEFSKKIALEDAEKRDESLRYIAALIVDSQDVWKELYSKYKITGALKHIKDQEFLKGTVDEKEEEYAALEYIEDQDFLKKIATTSDSYRAVSSALDNITDQKFLREYVENRLEYARYAYENIEDEDYLKERFQATEDLHTKTAILHGIKDEKFLAQVAKKASAQNVRLAAVRSIKSGDVLADIFLKARGVGDKQAIINALKGKDDILIDLAEKDKEKGGTYVTQIYRTIESKEAAKKVLESGVFDYYLYHIVEEDKDYLKKLINSEEVSFAVRDAVAERLADDDKELGTKYYLENEERLLKENKAKDFIDKIDDTEAIETFLLSDRTRNGYEQKNAFDRLVELGEMESMQRIARSFYVDKEIRKKAVHHIADLDTLKEIALESGDLAEVLLPKFKKDKKFLDKLLVTTTSSKVRTALLKVTKDQNILKEVAKGDNEEALVALSRLDDPKHLKEVLLSTKKLSVVKALLANKHIDVDTVEEYFKKNLGRDVNTAVSCAKILYENGKVTKGFIDSVPSFIDPTFAYMGLAWVVADNKEDDLLLQIVVSAPRDPAIYAFRRNRDPEFAEKVYKEAKVPDVKGEALLRFTPEKLKPEMVEEFINALSETEEPQAVSMELKVAAYKAGNDMQQDFLVNRIPSRHWNERHLKDKEQEEYHYLKPKTQFKYQKGIIKQMDHEVSEMPQQEILRLLVRLAR